MQPLIIRDGLPVRWVEDPAHKIPGVFLEEEEYGRAQQALSIVCTDIIPYNQADRTIYLAKRSVKPMQGWWWIGGRLKAGEELTECVRRKLKEEVVTDVTADRLRYLNVAHCRWAERQQEPKEYGSDGMIFVFAFEPTEEELANLAKSLVGSEYEPDSLRAFTQQEVETGDFHPLILHFYNQIFP